MNTEARLYYHLQQKEEKLEKQARELELTQREVQIKEVGNDMSMKIFREKLENTQLLFQTKMENLNSLMNLREEGWKQRLEQSNHESKVKDYLHQNEVNILHHETKITDWLHEEEVDRLQHTMDMEGMIHENERILDNVQHHRELFDLDQVIAQKIHDVHMLQEQMQTLDSRLVLQDTEMGILKEQSVLENKRGQLKDEQLRLSGAEMTLLEKMSRYREEYHQRERSIDRERDEIELKHYRLLDESIDNRETKLDIKSKAIELYGDRQDFDLAQKLKDILRQEEELDSKQDQRDLDFDRKRLTAERDFFNRGLADEQRRWKFQNQYHTRKQQMEEYEQRAASASKQLSSLDSMISSSSNKLRQLEKEREEYHEVNRDVQKRLNDKKRELGL